MGRKQPQPGTLAAFAESGGCYIVCKKCRHYSALNGYETALRFGWAADMNEVLPHFYCRKCKAKDCYLSNGLPKQPQKARPNSGIKSRLKASR